MYSLMSMRIMAFSSLKRTSANDLQSSVFPTPVGPRNRNEPMGRSGSCKPLRLRRTALATAETASVCPTTRSCRRSSSCSSFCFSVSIMRDTGTPVQALTTSAISSSVTFSPSKRFWGVCSPSCSSSFSAAICCWSAASI